MDVLSFAESLLGEGEVSGDGEEDEVGVLLREFVDVLGHEGADARVEARDGGQELFLPLEFMESAVVEIFVDEMEIGGFHVDAREIAGGVDGFSFESNLSHAGPLFEEDNGNQNIREIFCAMPQ